MYVKSAQMIEADHGGRYLSGLVIQMTTLSAYNPILWATLLIWRPVINGLFLITSASGSIRAKIRVESGQPCLLPLEI